MRKIDEPIRIFLPKETLNYFRQLSTNCRGLFDEKKYQWLVENASKTVPVDDRKIQPKKREEIEKISYEKPSLETERKNAMSHMMKNYSREQRLLIMFEQDSKKFLDSFSSEKFKDESKRQMVVGELKESFVFLTEKMREFRWSKEFLLSQGIEFKKLRKLYFDLCRV